MKSFNIGDIVVDYRSYAYYKVVKLPYQASGLDFIDVIKTATINGKFVNGKVSSAVRLDYVRHAYKYIDNRIEKLEEDLESLKKFKQRL